MVMTLAEIRARLRELEARATKAPWKRTEPPSNFDKNRFYIRATTDGGGLTETIAITTAGKRYEERLSNARLIAESRNHLVALLDALEVAERALEPLVVYHEEQIEMARNDPEDGNWSGGEPASTFAKWELGVARAGRAALAKLRGEL